MAKIGAKVMAKMPKREKTEKRSRPVKDNLPKQKKSKGMKIYVKAGERANYKRNIRRMYLCQASLEKAETKNRVHQVNLGIPSVSAEDIDVGKAMEFINCDVDRLFPL